MGSIIMKRMFLGFICLHVLHHAAERPVYGSWMIEELSQHGYKLSPGTLYPILHSLESEGLLSHYDENVSGKMRKYYIITELGRAELENARRYLAQLAKEAGERREDHV